MSAQENDREAVRTTIVGGRPTGSGRGSSVDLPERRRRYFKLIIAHPDIFPGFYHFDLAGNVRPKLELLQHFGFYLRPELAAEANPETCGAHSPAVGVNQ